MLEDRLRRVFLGTLGAAVPYKARLARPHDECRVIGAPIASNPIEFVAPQQHAPNYLDLLIGKSEPDATVFTPAESDEGVGRAPILLAWRGEPIGVVTIRIRKNLGDAVRG